MCRAASSTLLVQSVRLLYPRLLAKRMHSLTRREPRPNPRALGSTNRSLSLATSSLAFTTKTQPTLSPSISAIQQRSLAAASRSEEHTSELQSRQYLVCRLLLEKKKTTTL